MTRTISTVADIRQAFLHFFEQHAHQIVASSSLIPANDPTLLFTNAGMVQFKDVFLGREKKPYQRAASSQRVVRAGGKHNDLENVGYTARHHTFFEMLGNFSFGDYFKREAIQFAWSFLTEVLQLPPEKLWVTVYFEDDEAYNIWAKEIHIPVERIARLGEKDNFWSMGDTGPCGPCTEIFYDHGPEVVGGPPGSEEADGDRYIEIWNLVFMQFDRQADGTLNPLPKPSVDTGMGLERIAAVMQGVHNNYDIDLFRGLINGIKKVIGVEENNITQHSIRVIADHIRSTSFLTLDGITPSNEGRGYVLRRIIRRALRHGYKLNAKVGFFAECVPFLVQEMCEAYPELKIQQTRIMQVLAKEEAQFSITLDQGMQLLLQAMKGLENNSNKIIPGETVFTLYDTYGFPPDLTDDIARENNCTLDWQGFDVCMLKQKQRSKQHSGFKLQQVAIPAETAATIFHGYEKVQFQSPIQAIVDQHELVKTIEAGTDAIIAVEQSPFYAESGGQVGDRGWIKTANAIFRVDDTKKQGSVVLHIGQLEKGELSVGEIVVLDVDTQRRAAIRRHHSATHLLHAALRKVLGTHVQQKGSLVDDMKLRFDFSHPNPISSHEIQKIETEVMREVLANVEVTTQLMSIEKAKASGAMALFGEKYDDEVRVLTMGEQDYSIELCGGTHVSRTGDIGSFRIVQESAVASGVRRIEAVAGWRAWQLEREERAQITALTSEVKAPLDQLLVRFKTQNERIRTLEKEQESLKKSMNSGSTDQWLSEKVMIGEIAVLVIDATTNSNVTDAKSARDLVDVLKQKLGSGLVMVFFTSDNSIGIAAGVSSDHVKKYAAGQWVKNVCDQMTGKGGGRADMAMGGGGDPAKLSQAKASALEWVAFQ
ncbi:MAG: alanine--tRNA ligase [Pseudomonadota bacterium]